MIPQDNGGCSDNMATATQSSDLTCGWYEEESGNGLASVIPYSQGFCCRCSSGTSNGIRGGVECPALSSTLGGPEVAHCMRYSDRWYSLYRAKAPLVEDEVTLSVEGALASESSAPSFSVSSLSGPTFASFCSGNSSASSCLQVLVEVAGLLEVNPPLPDFALKAYLGVPSLPSSDLLVSTGQGEGDPLKHAVLLSTDLVDISGDSCDKVGVSFKTFVLEQGQGSLKCRRNKGDCLKNQLQQLIREGKTSVPSDLCQELGGVLSPRGSSSAAVSVSCSIPYRQASLVTLELTASSLSFVRKVGAARIGNVTVEGGVALLESGRAIVEVFQDSVLNSTFYGEVTCEEGLTAPGGAYPVFLTADNVVNPAVLIFFLDLQSGAGGEAFGCDVLLRNVEGGVADTMSFLVDMEETPSFGQAQTVDGTVCSFSLFAFWKSFADGCVVYGVLSLSLWVLVIIVLVRWRRGREDSFETSDSEDEFDPSHRHNRGMHTVRQDEIPKQVVTKPSVVPDRGRIAKEAGSRPYNGPYTQRDKPIPAKAAVRSLSPPSREGGVKGGTRKPVFLVKRPC